MAGQNIARLGVVLGLDTAQFQSSVDEAIAANRKLTQSIKRDSESAAGEILKLKQATDDYGKELTKTEQIQRQLDMGKYANSVQSVRDELLKQAQAYDETVAAAQKMSQIADTEKAVQAEINRLTVSVQSLNKALSATDIIQQKIAQGKFGDITAAHKEQLLTAARAADEHAKSLDKVTNAAGLSSFQMQNLVYQLNDVFVSLVSGQAPLTVLIQQGSQIAPIFGGVTAAISGLVDILGTAFVAALTNPITAVVALVGAVVALTAAFISGQNENNKFINSLILSGNYANITKGQFDAMAQSLASNFNTTTSGAKDLIGQLVSSGKVGEKALEPTAQAIQKIANLSGESATKIASSLISSFDGSAASAKSLNEQYNFLTLEQYKHIEALEKQGKKAEGAAYTVDLLNASLQRHEEALSPLDKLWKGTKQAGIDAWDGITYAANTFAALIINIAGEIKNIAKTIVNFINETFGGVIKGITKAVIDAYNLVDKLLGGILTKFGNSVKDINEKVKKFAADANPDPKNVKPTVDFGEKKKIADYAASKNSEVQINNTQKELDLLKAALEVRIDAIEKTGEALKLKQEEIGLLQYQKDILKSNLALEQMGRKNILDIETQIKKIENDKIARSEQASKQGKQAQADILVGLNKEIDFLEKSKKVIEEKIAAQKKLNQAIIEENFKLELQQKAKETRQKAEELKAKPIGLNEFDDKRYDVKNKEKKELKALGKEEEFSEFQKANAEAIRDRARAELELIQVEEERIRLQQVLTSNERAALDATTNNFKILGERSRAAFAAYKAFAVAQTIIDTYSSAQKAYDAMAKIPYVGPALGAAAAGVAIAAGMVRVQAIQATSAPATARESGGPITAGKPYLVGEKGPELITPKSDGMVFPANLTADLLKRSGGNVSNISNLANNYNINNTANTSNVKNIANSSNVKNLANNSNFGNVKNNSQILQPSSIQARAAGGDIGPNNSYLVGEKGPELVIPKSNNNVIPFPSNQQDNKSQQKQAPQVNITINPGATLDKQVWNTIQSDLSKLYGATNEANNRYARR